jgi:hypothetical protein
MKKKSRIINKKTSRKNENALKTHFMVVTNKSPVPLDAPDAPCLFSAVYLSMKIMVLQKSGRRGVVGCVSKKTCKISTKNLKSTM